MAAVQRKLVHKQFNSPMGLYSQENVKATLDRELKAFGAEGIEVDDQISKPLNLANSAVLRAVEEEEQQAKSEFYPSTERQSRRRERGDADALHHTLHQQLLDQIKTHYLSHQQDVTIDRDTVLKINRLATKRHLLKRDHSWPPAEPAPGASNTDQAHPASSYPSHSIEALREKFQSPTMIIEPTAKEVREQRQKEGASPRAKERSNTPQKVADISEVFHQTPVAKGFSAPETKAADVDLGLVAPRCEYYEQLAHRRPTTPTLPTPTPYRPRPKRQAYSLDRGRSRRRIPAASVGAPELPPPKPRSSKPKVQRRCIKLATEVKISYGHEGDSEGEEEAAPREEVDLETVPLPPTPAAGNLNQAKTAQDRSVIDSLAAVKQQQQMALALASNGSISTFSQPNQVATRIVPVRVEASPDHLKLSAQQIYDDACSYLQDHRRQEMAEEEPTYVSATSGIKLLQRQGSTPGTPATPATPPPPLMRAKSGEKSANKAKQSRRQGGVYSLGTESETETEKQHEAHVEIAQLEAKYAHIQQSIAEHLRQIDAYMINAKQALERSVQTTPVPTPIPPPPPPPPPPAPARPISSGNNESWDIFAHRQSPILTMESPLQAILRQIYTRAAGLPLGGAKEAAPVEEPEESLTENVPIVERALEDLHKIAQALESKPRKEKEEVDHIEVRSTPAAVEAQHVVIEDDDTEYRHVSDVIANYEQLAKKEFEEWKEEQVVRKESKDVKQDLKESENKVQAKQDLKSKIEEPQELTSDKPESDNLAIESCAHEAFSAACCPICDELRGSPNNWGKLTKADQWRIANLHNEPLENYKATYEIRSPYISRQISWEETQAAPVEKLQRQRSFVEIVTTPASDSPPPIPIPPPPPPPPPPPMLPSRLKLQEPEVVWERSRSPSPLPSRKYPAPLIEAPQRSSSPFGLNPVPAKASPPSPVNLPQKYSHVPQLEGHNIGLLVKTATEPLQQSMSASSSMLAATPPATPTRPVPQPSPFDFPAQDSEAEKFRSLASFDEVQQQQGNKDFSFNRSFDNVSPRPYLGIEGYKRVAWPPASEERIIREFTPQPATQSPAPGSGGYYPQSVAAPPSHAAAAPPQQQQYGAPSYGGYQQQPAPQQPAPQWQKQQQQVPQQQYQPQPQAQAPYQQPQWNQQQPQQQQPSYQSSPYQQQPSQQQPSYYPQQNGGSTFAQPQYNSYSQPQQQQQPYQLPYSQDQPDLQQQPGAFAGQDSYRGASPGIITLRKEAPVTQKPAPVYTSQPAAVSYQGGSKLRGDLKWPPPEYKEAAARENEERRLLALGPVCRPRRVNRDYTGFFAKHQLNNAYPSYKVPPGTQHMFA
ncbi:hypothetical protein KR074_008822 [Drosophila pseudoananassae]|nr:hypothetical protein KR074_008822 [Drosophila pseudoananassae]